MSNPVPSRVYYLVAFAILIAGAAFCGWSVYRAIVSMGGELRQIVVPGRTSIRLPEAGIYTIFHEFRSAVNGRVYSAPVEIPGLHVTVSNPAGEAVEVRPARMSSTYSFDGREGVALFQFEIDRGGTYVIRGDYDAGGGPPTVLAIGRRFIGRLLGRVFGGLAVLFASAVIAFLVALATFIKRKKAVAANQVHSTAF